MPPANLKQRDVLKRLRKHDKDFEITPGGKHLKIFHPDIDGKPQGFPFPFTKKSDDVPAQYLKDIRRRFGLPDDFFD